MERWMGRVALVTGANSGIGEAIAHALVKAGMKVVGADINLESMLNFSEKRTSSVGSLNAVKCDVTSEKDVEELFEFINKEFGGLDVCINSAGVVYVNAILDGTPSEWKEMFYTNVVAVCHFSKLATQSMIQKGVSEGQIINICSIGGHITKACNFNGMNFYSASKHAVKFLTEGLRQEMIEKKLKIRVAEISPGAVHTNFIPKNWKEAFLKNENSLYKYLNTSDIATVATYILSCPPEVEVNNLLIRKLWNVD